VAVGLDVHEGWWCLKTPVYGFWGQQACWPGGVEKHRLGRRPWSQQGSCWLDAFDPDAGRVLRMGAPACARRRGGGGRCVPCKPLADPAATPQTRPSLIRLPPSCLGRHQARAASTPHVIRPPDQTTCPPQPLQLRPASQHVWSVVCATRTRIPARVLLASHAAGIDRALDAPAIPLQHMLKTGGGMGRTLGGGSGGASGQAGLARPDIGEAAAPGGGGAACAAAAVANHLGVCRSLRTAGGHGQSEV
jgi:hypothetical protein